MAVLSLCCREYSSLVAARGEGAPCCGCLSRCGARALGWAGFLATQSVGLHDSASQQQTKPFKQCLAHNKSLNINRLTQILCDTFSIAKKKKNQPFQDMQSFSNIPIFSYLYFQKRRSVSFSVSQWTQEFTAFHSQAWESWRLVAGLCILSFCINQEYPAPQNWLELGVSLLDSALKIAGLKRG